MYHISGFEHAVSTSQVACDNAEQSSNQKVKDHAYILEFFTNFVEYKNANIAYLVLTLPLKINWSNKAFDPEMQSSYT